MRVVFYSTCSNFYSKQALLYSVYPKPSEEWEKLKKLFPEHDFFVVTQEPSLFLLDGESSSSLPLLISQAKDAKTFSCDVISFKPDLAIAASFWLTPYDWLSIEDSLVGEELMAQGIKTVCHPVKTSLLCFDKKSTHDFLEENNFIVPPALYVHHDLFWAERKRKELSCNVYKDYVFTRLSKMNFPVVIKDTSGVSSYRMEVCRTFPEAKAFLLSGKNQEDKIIESYISGLQCGVEIYGRKGNYTVMPPMLFSVNKYGITSPKQGVKVGPMKKNNFPLEELKKEMLRLAEKLNFCGIAQIDLVLNENKWYILEINPRISGMTSSYASSLGMSVKELLLRISLGEKINSEEMMPVCNMKIPLCSEGDLQKLFSCEEISSVRQIHNTQAKQEREKGYGEIVFTGKEIKSLKETTEKLETKYPSLLEADFVSLAKEKLENLNQAFSTKSF